MYMPATVPRYNGGEISIRYMGAPASAMVEKKEMMKRAPMNVRTSVQHLVVSFLHWRTDHTS